MTKSDLAKIVKITSPIFFGYVSIGIPFGLMVARAGYPWWLAPLMSVTMYTGTGQYIAIGMFAAGAGLAPIMLIQVLVGIRHIFYGLSLLTKFKGVGKWKAFLVYALTDETYAVLCAVDAPQGQKPGPFYAAIAALDEFYWTLGATIGAVAGSLINFSFEGVDFALTALFCVILTEQILASKDFVPPAIGIAASVAAAVLERTGILPQGNMLLVSLSVGIAALVLAKNLGKPGAKTESKPKTEAGQNLSQAQEGRPQEAPQ
ncbi:MAG: AzlC family ABC transporter permease [Treponema sp.]|nr:AzlC family ABC transporter permease [Treponema sp.]